MKKVNNKKLFTFHFSLLTSSASRQKGLTLIEMMAAIAIFSAMIAVITSVYISAITSQRRSAYTVNINNAAYFAMETMAKEIRTGTGFSCQSGIDSSCDEIRFTNYHNDIVRYKSANNQIEKVCESNSSGNCAAGAITSSSVNVSYLKFNLIGTGSSDGAQARIILTAVFETPSGTPQFLKRDIKLQTTISPRNPDN